MHPSVPTEALAALGDDLFLLSLRPRDGKVTAGRRIEPGLMASELVRLAAAGRVEIVQSRIVVRDRADTGDPGLDAALLSLISLWPPPRAETWVGLPRPGIVDAYAGRLIAAGVLRADPTRILRTPRYRITEPARAEAAWSRLDAVAWSEGPPADVAQAALGGLVSAIGLASVLYPGHDGWAQRERLGGIARRMTTARAARQLSGADLWRPGAGMGVLAGAVPPGQPENGSTDGVLEAVGDAGASLAAAALAVIAAAEAAAVHAVISGTVDGTSGHHAWPGGGDSLSPTELAG